MRFILYRQLKEKGKEKVFVSLVSIGAMYETICVVKSPKERRMDKKKTALYNDNIERTNRFEQTGWQLKRGGQGQPGGEDGKREKS